jgi:hypothetical protein
MDDFKLVPASVPKKKVKRGAYIKAVEDFLEMGVPSVMVECGVRLPHSVYLQLQMTVKAMGVNVSVAERMGQVYLAEKE